MAAKESLKKMLNFSNVHMKFDKDVLSDINLNIDSGEFVSILGPSGCGKSTLLRLASNLAKPTKGVVDYISPKDLSIGFVFQNPTLMPWRTVMENITLPLELNKKKFSKEEALMWLARVGLKDKEKSYPNELSGGQMMRVSIARSLINGCNLLLLDEPFAALDEITRRKLEDDLLEIWEKEKFTVLFVTHSVSEAIYLSQRVLVLSSGPGKIVYEKKISQYISKEEFRESKEFQAINSEIFEKLKSGVNNE